MLRDAAATLTIEANAVSDNPLIVPDTDEAQYGGNFHAGLVAFVADVVAMALCEVGSERRTAVLVDPRLARCPPSQSRRAGSILAHDAAGDRGRAGFRKQVARLPRVGGLDPTSAGQEDHVSMATHGARKAGAIGRNAAGVVGIELLAAAQGVDFHAPLRTSARLQESLTAVRAISAPLVEDRYWATDLAAIQGAVLDRRFEAPLPLG